MFLVFIVSLACLSMAILRELELRKEFPALRGGECPDCASPVEAGWLACPRCRRLLRGPCDNCGEHVDAWFPFCPKCGAGRKGETRR